MTMDRSSESVRSSPIVLSIECLKGSSKAEEWTGDMLQTGDIVEELKIGASISVKSPFKNGRAGVQKLLHTSFRAKDTSILVRVRRGRNEFAELQACIVPDSAGKKQYMLRSIDDPNYTVGLLDRTESACFQLQDSRSVRMVNALRKTKPQDGYVSYPWERRMQEMLWVPKSSSFLSFLLLPKSSDRAASRYNDLDDTLARAHAWLNASQASGVPIVFMNIQTESLLTKISGDTASSTVSAGSLSDLANLANSSLYGFEDYHGVDIGVVRAVRLWFAPLGGEAAIEITIREGDTKLGFSISRTEEGFIYVSSVTDKDEDVPSSRSGLVSLYKEAESSSRLLVVSRLSNQKVLPWMASPTGAIRCFDTMSLSHKLSLHRHARVPIIMHLFMWDRDLASSSFNQPTPARPRPSSLPPAQTLPPEVLISGERHPNDNQVLPLPPEDDHHGDDDDDDDDDDDADDERLQGQVVRDTGDMSFRFQDFALSSSWV